MRAISAAVFLVVAGVLASVLPSERAADPVLALGLVGGYALVSRVRFEFGDLYVVPEQLVFVAMLALAPLPLIPLMVAAGAVLGVMPDFLRGLWHGDRTITTIGDCWFSLGPVLVLAALAPGPATLALAEVYVLAYLAQVTCDLCGICSEIGLTDKLPIAGVLSSFGKHRSNRRDSLADRLLGFGGRRSGADRPGRLGAASSGYSRSSPATVASGTRPHWSSTAPTEAR